MKFDIFNILIENPSVPLMIKKWEALHLTEIHLKIFHRSYYSRVALNVTPTSTNLQTLFIYLPHSSIRLQLLSTHPPSISTHLANTSTQPSTCQSLSNHTTNHLPPSSDLHPYPTTFHLSPTIPQWIQVYFNIPPLFQPLCSHTPNYHYHLHHTHPMKLSVFKFKGGTFGENLA